MKAGLLVARMAALMADLLVVLKVVQWVVS
jgi:hypothetical protein